MNHKAIIRSAKITAPQKAQITSAEKRVDDLHNIVLETAADRDLMPSRLHYAADCALDAFHAAPSLEAANEFHAAKLRCETAKLTAELIGDSVYQKLGDISRSLSPIALSILDQAETTVRTNLETALAAAEKETSIFDGVGAVRAQAEALLLAIAGERPHAEADGLRFLVNNGFSVALV